jgi:DNA processing protein
MESSEYPDILKEIAACPPVLYVRGHKEALNTTGVGVVGTRKMTTYGRAVTDELVTGLVNSKITIVSGLAFGVDARSLHTCVELGGHSVAVLASPLDNASIAPKSNFQLAERIMESGCLVSEYPLGAVIQKQNFPIRNRIIAGLSVGTVVVEADTDSGSLITANYALEQNREVFAVPGPIFSDVSRGTNELIKKGAKLVTSYFDILQELNLDLAPTPTFETNEPASDTEQFVIEKLTREPTHIDDLVRELNLPASDVNATLLMLEMKGRVRNLGGAKFAKIR